MVHSSLTAADLSACEVALAKQRQRRTWIAQNFFTQLLVFDFTASGWVLATTVGLSLTGLLKKD